MADLSFALTTDMIGANGEYRHWRLGLFFAPTEWGLGPQVSYYGPDWQTRYRLEIHLRIGPLDLQFMVQPQRQEVRREQD